MDLSLTGPDVALGNPHISVTYDYESCVKLEIHGDIVTHEYLPAIGIEIISISIRLCDLLSLPTKSLFICTRIHLNPRVSE
jgi:hypothetical protein